MRVAVDLDLCEANGVCESHAPEVFHVNDDDELEIAQGAIDEGLRESLDAAISRCPRGALSLIEGSEG